MAYYLLQQRQQQALLALAIFMFTSLSCHAFSFGWSDRGVAVSNNRRRNSHTQPTFTYYPKNRKLSTLPTFSTTSSDIHENEDLLLTTIRSMRVKELKSELKSLSISTNDVFEKEELVQRLFKARSNNGNTASNFQNNNQHRNTPTSNSEYSTNGNKDSSMWTITAPLLYYELESSKSVAAQNAQDIYLRPSPGKYAAIKITLQSQSSSSDLTLLVDTACSGIVLSPKAVSRANSNSGSGSNSLIQMVSTASATMMTAGGAQGGYSVAKWNGTTKVMAGGVDLNSLNLRNMPNMAAVQDIGALPGMLDGIIGLSFLNQFACVDFDFANNELRLHKSNLDPPENCNENDEKLSIVAQGPLTLTKLGIYTVQTTLDGRDPVRLLVDTGAASTFLNWKGVSDLNLSESSPQIERNTESLGAMGADNMALQLTHRYILQRRWNLVGKSTARINGAGSENYTPGLSLRGTDYFNTGGVNLDIGDLPVLDALKGDGVGGILGADLLMMCDVVRFCGLNGRSPTMILMKK